MYPVLSKQDVYRLVNEYIGVFDGYLGDFSYRSHTEFYPQYCNLDIDPNEIDGTTRVRFISILLSQPPLNQAKIIRGVLARFPLSQEKKPISRTRELFTYFEKLAQSVEKQTEISDPSISSKYQIVLQALHDAEILIKESTPSSGVDRVITSLQGYMEEICHEIGASISEEETIVSLFKLIKNNHPAFTEKVARPHEITKIINSLSAIIDAFQPIRNKASLAHPNKDLLENAESLLVINASRTVLNYLSYKIHHQ